MTGPRLPSTQEIVESLAAPHMQQAKVASATMATAELMDALVVQAKEQALQLTAMAQVLQSLADEASSAARAEQERHNRTIWWARLSVLIGALAAVAALAAVVVSL